MLLKDFILIGFEIYFVNFLIRVGNYEINFVFLIGKMWDFILNFFFVFIVGIIKYFCRVVFYVMNLDELVGGII